VETHGRASLRAMPDVAASVGATLAVAQDRQGRTPEAFKVDNPLQAVGAARGYAVPLSLNPEAG
jgi:hypothetical protein